MKLDLIYPKRLLRIDINIQEKRYCSQFNPIELIFKSLKRKIYSHLYETFEQVDKEVINFFEDKSIEITVLGNYAETLNQYINYIENNNNIDINGFKIFEWNNNYIVQFYYIYSINNNILIIITLFM